MRPEVELLISTCGIYFCYLYYGILQERIYKPDPVTGDRFTSTLFLLSVQCVFNFAVGGLGMLITGQKGTQNKASDEIATTSPLPFKHSGTLWLAFTSFSYLSAMGCSNQSLQFVSYPFQALAKSCKMVPVMLANVIVGGKKYSLLEYICVFMITGGVLLFNLGKSKNTNFVEGSSMLGVFLLFGSLAFDGLTGSNQRLFTNEYKPSSHYMMMSMNMWSLVYLLPVLGVTGEGIVGLQYILTHQQTLFDITMFSLCSALGQQFIFFCVVGPGPLACTTITTTRKFFTVLLSVLLYPENALNSMQWTAVFLVFSGLTIELINKSRKNSAAGAKKTK